MSSKKDATADSHDAPRPRSSDGHDPATSDDRDDSQETVLETSFGASTSASGPEATWMEDEADREIGATSPASASPAGSPASSPSSPSWPSSPSSPALGAPAGASARPVGSKTLFGLGDGGLPFPGLAKSLADLRAGYAESLARAEGPARAEGTPTTQFPAVASPAAPDFLSEVTDALNAQARMARARALGGQAADPAADSISGPGHRNIREATGESTGNWSVGTAARVSSWVEAEFEDPDDGPTLLTPGIISITEDAFEAPVLEAAPGVDALGDTESGPPAPAPPAAAHDAPGMTASSGEESVVIGMHADEDSLTLVPLGGAETRTMSEAAEEVASSQPLPGAHPFPAESAGAAELLEPAWGDVRPGEGEGEGEGKGEGDGEGSLAGLAATATATAAQASESTTGGEIATAAEATAAAALEPTPVSAQAAAALVTEPPDEPPSDTQIDARLGGFVGTEGPTPIPESLAASSGPATDTSTGEPGWFAPRWSPASPFRGDHAAAPAHADVPAPSTPGAPGHAARATATRTPTEGRPSAPAFGIPPGTMAVPRTNTPLSSFATLPAPPLVSADGKRLTLPPGTPAMGLPDRAPATPKVNLRRASLAAIVGGAFAGGVLVGVLVGRGGGAAAHGTADVALVSAPSNPTVATDPKPGAGPSAPAASASTPTVTPIPAAPAPAGPSAPANAAAAPTTTTTTAATAIVSPPPSPSPSPPVAAIAVPPPPEPSTRAAASHAEPGRAGVGSSAPTVVPTTAGEHLARATGTAATRSQTPRLGARAKRQAAGAETAAAAGPRTAPPPLAAQAPAASPSTASKPAVAGRPQVAVVPKSTPPSKTSGAVAKASVVVKSPPPKGPWHDPFAD
jgi:Meckel syndrome type 1 protein